MCSAHFIGNTKSDEECAPNYVPTIFSLNEKEYQKFSPTVKGVAATERHRRFLKRRISTPPGTSKILKKILPTNNILDLNTVETDGNNIFYNSRTKDSNDKGCQVNSFEEPQNQSTSFTCNRYIVDNICHAETQSDIITNLFVISNSKLVKDKSCGTDITYESKCIGFCTDHLLTYDKKIFLGIDSIKNDEQLIDLAGLSFAAFNLFVPHLPELEKCSVSKRNRLLIFCIKMKTGLSYSALSVLFQVHRTTISRIFINTLEHLYGVFQNQKK